MILLKKCFLQKKSKNFEEAICVVVKVFANLDNKIPRVIKNPSRDCYTRKGGGVREEVLNFKTS